MSSHKAQSPNQREVISAVSSITGLQEYLTSTNGALNTTGGGGGGGGTQYINGSAQATPTGTVSLGYDGANVRAIKTATDGTTQVQLNASQANTTGSITSAASVVTVTDLMGVGAVTVLISGTYAGVNVTFETSVDAGTTWVAVAAQPLGTTNPVLATSTGILTTNSTNAWNISPLLGTAQFRVRATAWTSGSASVVISPSAQFVNYMDNAITNSAEVSYSFTTSGTGAQMVGNFNSAGYAWVQIQYTAIGTGAALTGQFSLDSGTTWNAASSWQAGNSTSNANSALTAALQLFTSRVWGPLFRLNFTALTTGPVTGTITFTNAPLAYSTQSIAGTVAATQSGTWTVGANSAIGAAVPANAFYTAMMDNSGNLVGIGSALRNLSVSTSGGSAVAVGNIAYNGTTFDMGRTATSANGTTGTGVPAAGAMGFDGTNFRRLVTDTLGTQVIRQKASTSTHANVSTSTTSATLIAANALRLGGSVYNDSSVVLYVATNGSAASATNFKIAMAAGSYYEIPAGITTLVTGVLASGTGTARVDEDTA